MDNEIGKQKTIISAMGVMVMGGQYVVTVFDCAGEYIQMQFGSFMAALLEYEAWRKWYRPQSKIVHLSNIDNVDLGCADGLTKEEREVLDEIE